jgi:hypothetical protein
MPSTRVGYYTEFPKALKELEEANQVASHELLRSFAKKLPPHHYNVRGIALQGIYIYIA